MERDPLIRSTLWDRISTVGGRGWTIRPARDPEECDIEAARVVGQLVANLDYGEFHAARIQLARFFWKGATFGALYGRRMLRKYGDDEAREWWVPKRIRDIDKRRVRVYRQNGGIERTLERIIEKNGEISFETDPFPADRVIAAIYDNSESQLGFGRGSADACYWPFVFRWKLREEGFEACRAWAQGVLHGQIDGAVVGDASQDSESIRDEM